MIYGGPGRRTLRFAPYASDPGSKNKGRTLAMDPRRNPLDERGCEPDLYVDGRIYRDDSSGMSKVDDHDAIPVNAIEEAERRIGIIFERLKLTLHPEKTRKVDLTGGKEGFDFLGCHLHMRMSGRLLEAKGVRRYYLQRWPSKRSMKRVRTKVQELCHRRQLGVKDVREVVVRLNPVLRGWGNYFRTGNAARKFNQLDTYVYLRLRNFMVERRGRNLRVGQSKAWTRDWFWGHGLHRLRGTVRYPKPCMLQS